MFDPKDKRFIPVRDEAEVKATQRDWTRFEEGEIIFLKNIKFCVHEIGERRIVLKPA